MQPQMQNFNARAMGDTQGQPQQFFIVPQQAQQPQMRYYDPQMASSSHFRFIAFDLPSYSSLRTIPFVTGFPTAAAGLLLNNPQPSVQQVREDPEVGSFLGFMTKPFMGVWDGQSKLARKLNVIDFRFPSSNGDNNYHEAPEEYDRY